MSLTIADIWAAARTIEGQVVKTPAIRAARLSADLGLDLFLKLENMQATGSFKERGAINKLSSLTAEQRKAGVIAMSAGNHAQAVAYHATRMGIPSTVVMPDFAPLTKIERTEAFGARVILSGDTLDASAEAASAIAEAEGLTLVHPYDDEQVIAGQGTIGLELMDQRPGLEVLVVPIGGGGLISGIALAAKALKPDIEIYGVEAAFYPSMHHAVNGLDPRCGGHTLADGIAVKNPGRLTRPVIERCVDDIILVDEGAIESAIAALAEKQKLVAEGAGAAGVAALLAQPGRFRNRRVGVVICGGNLDNRILAGVLTRGLVRDGRMASLRIQITDRPGVLARIAQVIGEAGGNIIEVHHQRHFQDIPVRNAEIDVLVETRSAAERDALVDRLAAIGFPTRVLSNQSMYIQRPGK